MEHNFQNELPSSGLPDTVIELSVLDPNFVLQRQAAEVRVESSLHEGGQLFSIGIVMDKILNCDEFESTPAIVPPVQYNEQGTILHRTDYPCGKCDAVLITLPDLVNHYKVCKKILHCNYCEYQTHRKTDIKQHIEVHISEKYEEFKCIICNKIKLTKENLRTHVKSEHSDILPKPFCIICGHFEEQCKTNYLFVIHKRFAHAKLDSYPCDICKQTYTKFVGLRNHIKKFHYSWYPARPLKVNCPVCQKSFQSNEELKLHLKAHDVDHPYICKQCSKAFKTLPKLKVHEKIHKREYALKCSICKRDFSSKTILNVHIKQVHDNIREFKCKICTKDFLTKESLQKHIKNAHTKERPFACHLCDKRFILEREMKSHAKLCILDRTRQQKNAANLNNTNVSVAQKK